MSQLERVTVNLIPLAQEALETGMERTGYNKTDFINRAIQAYAYLEEIFGAGGDILTREAGQEELSRIVFF